MNTPAPRTDVRDALRTLSVDQLLSALKSCQAANKPRAESWVRAELASRGVTQGA